MFDIFRHLLANIKGPDKVAPASQGIALAERILSERKYSSELASEVAIKSLFERWEVVNALLSIKPNPAFHFLHVPKTGGTTFGETLGKDKKVVILSVDATPDTLTKQLVRFANAENQNLVLARAHHSLGLVYNTGCYQRFRLGLTAYRPPANIHISNVNMIMRRIRRYEAGQSRSESELQFSQEWLSTMPGAFEYSADYAHQLLISEGYRQRMGGVYQRFFNSRNWQSLITKKQLFVIDAQDLDVLLTSGFGYQIPPERRNVSVKPLLSGSDVSEQEIAPLIAPDYEIASFLQQHLSDPELISERLFGEKHQVGSA